MPLRIVRNDITAMACDAIVNPTDTALSGGGGADAAIHRAAGPELDAACSAIGFCAEGEAVCTPGFALPSKYVFHTVGPQWHSALHQDEILAHCYRACLELTEKYPCATIAFPIISAGTFGFPKERALRVAMREITDWLMEHELTVFLVVYNREIFQIGKRLAADVQEFIDDCYIAAQEQMLYSSSEGNAPARPGRRERRWNRPVSSQNRPQPRRQREDAAHAPFAAPEESDAFGYAPPSMPSFSASYDMAGTLEDALDHLDESFTEMLLRKIDERGMKDSECYKRANVDRKLFSKIRNDLHYKPRKTTAIAFAIALELSLEETEDLLRKAGYALSRSSKFDTIIEFFIRRENYNIYEINETLFYFDQVLLGA